MSTENKMSKEDKDKLVGQTHQMFNIAEKPVLEFISAFLEEEPSVLFNEEITDECDPLILLPLEDYKKNIYLKFTLKHIHMADDDDKRKESIDKLIMHEQVKEGIGFLLYCVKNVYSSILASNLINNKPLVNITLDLDENNWVIYPKFLHEFTHKKDFFEMSLGKVMTMQKNINDFPKEMVPEINKEFHTLIKSLTDVNNQITPEIKELENKINASYEDKVKLGIFVEEITKRDLPKPKKHIQKAQLPIINSPAYTD